MTPKPHVRDPFSRLGLVNVVFGSLSALEERTERWLQLGAKILAARPGGVLADLVGPGRVSKRSEETPRAFVLLGVPHTFSPAIALVQAEVAHVRLLVGATLPIVPPTWLDLADPRRRLYAVEGAGASSRLLRLEPPREKVRTAANRGGVTVAELVVEARAREENRREP